MMTACPECKEVRHGDLPAASLCGHKGYRVAEGRLEALMGAVVELGLLTGISTPGIDTIYALTRLLDKTMREDHGAVQMRSIA